MLYYVRLLGRSVTADLDFTKWRSKSRAGRFAALTCLLTLKPADLLLRGLILGIKVDLAQFNVFTVSQMSVFYFSEMTAQGRPASHFQTMADQQPPRFGGEGAPMQQPPLADTEDTSHSIHLAFDYGATESTTASVLSPVDEDRQSRPKPTQPQNASSAQQLSTLTSALPTSDYPHHSGSLSGQPLSAAMEQAAVHGVASSDVPAVSAPHLTNNIYYQSPAMGPLTPPRSPLAGEVMYHNHHQQQAIHVSSSGGGPITPPRTQSSSLKSKGSAKRSKGKSQKSGSKRSSKKSNKRAPDTFTELSKGGGVASSIKKSLSNISLFTSTDGDTGDEEAALATASTSLRFGSGTTKSYHDEDLTSAHHRAELYGQIGGPTGLIGAYGERRGCKRFLVLITLAFILLSLVLQKLSDGTTDGGGTKEGTTAAPPSSQEIDSFLKGEIGELTPGKCRQVIDKETADLEEAIRKNDDLEKEIRRLETVIEELKKRMQMKEDEEIKGGEEHGR